MPVTRGSSQLKTKHDGSVNKIAFNTAMFGFQKNNRKGKERELEEKEPEYVPTISPDLLDQEDDENDKKVTDILELLKKIEHFNGTQLTGKERRKYLQKKLVELGVQPPKPPSVPFKARIRMKETKEKKEKQEREDARYSGMLSVKSKRN